MLVSALPATRPKETSDTIAIYFSMVVWGESFVRFFLEFCLPSLLSSGNLPCIGHRRGSRFILHTRSADLPLIQNAPAYQLLRETIEVEIRTVVEDDVAHQMLSRCHRETMNAADAAEVPIVFLSPDTIWSDGSIASVDRLLSSGKRVIFLSSFRLTKEEAEPYLRERFSGRGTTALAIGARELNRVALRFLHPLMEEYFFEPGRGAALLPMLLLWQAPNGDVLAHGFHQHPLLVYPTKRFAGFLQTIDGDLVQSACPEPEFHHIVQDSDEITAIELSKRDHFIAGLFEKGDATAVAEWAMAGANSVHWQLFPVPLRMHACDVDPVAWQSVEERASEVVCAILKYRRERQSRIAIEERIFRAAHLLTGVSQPAFSVWLDARRRLVRRVLANPRELPWFFYKVVVHLAVRPARRLVVAAVAAGASLWRRHLNRGKE